MTIEEALRKIEGKAALLRYFASSASINPEIPDPNVLAGIGETAGEIEEAARDSLSVLSADALGQTVDRPQRLR